MIPGLVALLIVLLGATLRVRPAPRSSFTIGADDACRTGRGAERARLLWRSGLVAGRIGTPSTSTDPMQVAAWCDGLARAVGSGSTLVAAVREVEPPIGCTAAVGRVRLALERGVALQDACAIDVDSVDLRIALTVLRACAIQGGSPAEPISRTAATLRGRAADAAERRTQSAQAHLSAVVMTVLPICMLALLLLTSGPVRGFAASPIGLTVIAVGASLNLVGWRWMRRIIGADRK